MHLVIMIVIFIALLGMAGVITKSISLWGEGFSMVEMSFMGFCGIGIMLLYLPLSQSMANTQTNDTTSLSTNGDNEEIYVNEKSLVVESDIEVDGISAIVSLVLIGVLLAASTLAKQIIRIPF